jgi:hypothetical protein
LLESVRSKTQHENSTTESSSSVRVPLENSQLAINYSQNEFHSPTAESIQKAKVIVDSNPADIETDEEKKQFQILSHGNIINYKKMLEYLSNTMNFAVNYQSLLGVSVIRNFGVEINF